MGGVAGHAGFVPAVDLAWFAAWWVSDSDAVVPAALRRSATTRQTEGLGGHRGFGWPAAAMTSTSCTALLADGGSHAGSPAPAWP